MKTMLLICISCALAGCSTPRPDPVMDSFEAAFVRELAGQQEAMK